LILRVFRPAGPDWRGGFLYVIFAVHIIGGAVVSLYHAFGKGEKDLISKWLMAIFALFVNGVAGVFAGTEMLADYTGAMAMFPIVNIVTGSLLIYQVGLSPEDCITDEDATGWDLVIGLISLIIIYAYLELRFELSWAVEFSVCIAYASLFHRFTRIGVSALQRWIMRPAR
jgi:hypothetical protein